MKLIEKVALGLFDRKAIQFGEFTLASGKKSPYYVDLRLVPSFPELFTDVIELYMDTINSINKDFDAVAGIPTAGISFATRIAQRLNKPLLYVRTKPKGHGRKQMIEGNVVPGQELLLVDDLITDGGSKLFAVQSARESDMKVENIVVLLDRLQGGKDKLAQNSVSLHAACTILDILSILRSKNKISVHQEEMITRYVQKENR
ncbi:MAG: orotate phosphoribosyltransferase [Candidatus Ranarchaeia archaeon]